MIPCWISPVKMRYNILIIMSYLVLVRHGLSEYNKQGLWAGWADPALTPEGIEEAKKAGEVLKDIHFDYAYTNVLQRCIDTLEEIKKVLGQTNLPTVQNKAINERNYGDFTAKNKWQIKEQLGEEEFLKLRRSWDYPVPNGESLKQVYEREIPYFEAEILPKLKEGKNILISSSGNSLRALVKYLENIPDDQIANLEIGTGEVYVYDLDENGKVLKKETRTLNPMAGKV